MEKLWLHLSLSESNLPTVPEFQGRCPGDSEQGWVLVLHGSPPPAPSDWTRLRSPDHDSANQSVSHGNLESAHNY